MLSQVEAYVEYAHKPENAWELVERPILDYVFERFYCARFNSYRKQDTVPTTFGFPIAKDFQVLDLGTGTGRVPGRLIDYGVPADNIVGIDRNQDLLGVEFFPDGARKVAGDVRELDRLLGADESFDFITANMLFHLLSYPDYVGCLRQVRNHTKRFRTRVLIIVPHPLRRGIYTTGEYHAHSALTERAPWGEEIQVQQKTIQDYERGLFEAGFDTFYIATYGVGLDNVDSTFLIRDQASWRKIGRRKSVGKKRPSHLRLWLFAHPRG